VLSSYSAISSFPRGGSDMCRTAPLSMIGSYAEDHSRFRISQERYH
jgi:hypothetical protein